MSCDYHLVTCTTKVFFLHIYLALLVGCKKQRLCSPWPSREILAFRHSGGRPGHRAFQYASRIEEAPHAPRVGAGAAPPPNPPPRPANGSHRFPNTLGQVGEQYGPSIAPFARARCPFSPLLRPYSPGAGAARGSHTGQFSCFGHSTS